MSRIDADIATLKIAKRVQGVATVGYARVSTEGQNLAGQVAALKEAGATVILEEKASGVKTRATLDALLASLKSGQTLVVSSLSRLGRRMTELMGVFDDLEKKGVKLVCLKEGIRLGDHGNAIGDKMLRGIFAVMAEVERDLTAARRDDGIKEAKEAGKYNGRPKAKNPELDKVVQRVIKGGLSFADGVRICAGLATPVSKATFVRRVREAKGPIVIG